MERWYWQQLPTDARNLVDLIEHHTDSEIVVVADPRRARGEPDQPDPLACEVSESGASILTPAADYFPDASVLHELFHIRRFLVDHVPRIVMHDEYLGAPETETALTQLDNNLEHLIIVPEELRYRPERITYWQQAIQRALVRLASGGLHDDDRRRHAIVQSVFNRYVLNDSDLEAQLNRMLNLLDINERADRAFNSLVTNLDVKEKLVRGCFEHLDLPYDIAALEYLDVRNRQSSQISVADVGVQG